METKEIWFNDQKFVIQVLKLDKCGYIYIGDSTTRLDNMGLIMKSKYV